MSAATTKTNPSAMNCVRASTATASASNAMTSRRGEGAATARKQATQAQRKAGYAADSLITRPVSELQGTAIESTATTSAQRRDSVAPRASRYAGTAALAKSTPLNTS